MDVFSAFATTNSTAYHAHMGVDEAKAPLNRFV
jgi:hypothetical protein